MLAAVGCAASRSAASRASPSSRPATRSCAPGKPMRPGRGLRFQRGDPRRRRQGGRRHARSSSASARTTRRRWRALVDEGLAPATWSSCRAARRRAPAISATGPSPASTTPASWCTASRSSRASRSAWRSRRGKPVVVLPGFPTSAIFTFHEFVAPVIRAFAGLPPEEAERVDGDPAAARHLRARPHRISDGVARPQPATAARSPPIRSPRAPAPSPPSARPTGSSPSTAMSRASRRIRRSRCS